MIEPVTFAHIFIFGAILMAIVCGILLFTKKPPK